MLLLPPVYSYTSECFHRYNRERYFRQWKESVLKEWNNGVEKNYTFVDIQIKSDHNKVH